MKGQIHYIAFDLNTWDLWVIERANSISEWLRIWS